MPRRYLLNRVGRRVALPEQRESPDTHRVRVVLWCQRPVERQRKDRHPSLSGPRAFKILGAGKCRLVLQPGFYVRLKKSQTESIAGLYGHALPAPANMLISYMANRKPGCSTKGDWQSRANSPNRRQNHDRNGLLSAEHPPFARAVE